MKAFACVAGIVFAAGCSSGPTRNLDATPELAWTIGVTEAMSLRSLVLQSENVATRCLGLQHIGFFEVGWTDPGVCGVTVLGVVPPASEPGRLKTGDVIVSIGDVSVRGNEGLISEAMRWPLDRPVTLRVRRPPEGVRGSEARWEDYSDVAVTLPPAVEGGRARRILGFGSAPPPFIGLGDLSCWDSFPDGIVATCLGIEEMKCVLRGRVVERPWRQGSYRSVESLTGVWMDASGIFHGDLGVQVRTLVPDAPWARALAPGDIIVSVNDRPIRDHWDLRAVLVESVPDQPYRLRVRRAGAGADPVQPDLDRFPETEVTIPPVWADPETQEVPHPARLAARVSAQ